MASVPEQVLSWLYGVLVPEYHDARRTYSDVAVVLSRYPSCRPATDTYTFDNGAQALLLKLEGTVQVPFRGNSYHYPVIIWVPHRYPHDSPVVYAVSSEATLIAPGQHVSPDGRIYHPYLAQWAEYWDKSSLLDFILILRDIFAKEPPVRPRVSQLKASDAASSVTGQDAQKQQPPPRPPPPPRPNEARPQPGAVDTLPPKPPKLKDYHEINPSPANSTFTSTASNLQSRPMSVNSDTRGLTRQSVIGRPYQASPFPDGSNQSLPNQPTSVHLPYTSKPFIAPHPLLVAPTTALPPTHVQTRLAPETFPRHDPFATKLVKAKIVAPDLLSIPLDAAVLGLAKAGAPSQAPPIPPNPEKDAVLSALLAALRHKHAATLDNNGEALVSLRSQNQALLEARQWLQNELDEVSDLQAAAESNERILQEAMRKADVVMEDARQRTVPSVDEILMAPTRVGNQLYETCAEEVALREALFVLTKALDAGRIGVDSFFKQTRSLAREQFLKKALIKKIALGMGLDMPPAS